MHGLDPRFRRKEMTAHQALESLVERINGRPEGVSRMAAVYQLELSGAVYQVRVLETRAQLAEGTPWKTGCTIHMNEEDFLKLLSGELHPSAAYLTGKLKVSGNLGQALKLQGIFQKYRAT
jgi:putative sterol carrier protein